MVDDAEAEAYRADKALATDFRASTRAPCNNSAPLGSHNPLLTEPLTLIKTEYWDRAGVDQGGMRARDPRSGGAQGVDRINDCQRSCTRDQP